MAIKKFMGLIVIIEGHDVPGKLWILYKTACTKCLLNTFYCIIQTLQISIYASRHKARQRVWYFSHEVTVRKKVTHFNQMYDTHIKEGKGNQGVP